MTKVSSSARDGVAGCAAISSTPSRGSSSGTASAKRGNAPTPRRTVTVRRSPELARRRRSSWTRITSSKKAHRGSSTLAARASSGQACSRSCGTSRRVTRASSRRAKSTTLRRARASSPAASPSRCATPRSTIAGIRCSCAARWNAYPLRSTARASLQCHRSFSTSAAPGSSISLSPAAIGPSCTPGRAAVAGSSSMRHGPLRASARACCSSRWSAIPSSGRARKPSGVSLPAS